MSDDSGSNESSNIQEVIKQIAIQILQYKHSFWNQLI